MTLIDRRLGWRSKTSLEAALEATMRVFIEQYRDVVRGEHETETEHENETKHAYAEGEAHANGCGGGGRGGRCRGGG